MYRFDRGLVLAKIESANGVDATPAAATNAIITKGTPTFEVVNNPKSRDVALGSFGKLAPINVGDALKLSFTTELKGSGTPGTASNYGPLFRACNMTEALSAGVSVSYTPNSTVEGESVTLYFHHDGRLHKLLGCVGSFSAKLVSQEIVTIDWTFTGMYASGHETTVTFPTPTYEAIAPIIWKGAGLTVNSVASLYVHELNFDMANSIVKRLNANAATGVSRYFINNRAPKGNVVFESEPLATIDPYTLFNASTSFSIAAAVTGAAGNICSIAITGAVADAPKTSDKENVMMYDLPFSINPTIIAGNNEIVLTFT